MNGIRCGFAAGLLWLTAASAMAHEGSTTYLELAADRSALSGRVDVALIDVAASVPLDDDADRRLTWDEVWNGRSRVAEYLGNSFAFSRAGVPCTTEISEPWMTQRLGLPYLSLDVTASCAAERHRHRYFVALL